MEWRVREADERQAKEGVDGWIDDRGLNRWQIPLGFNWVTAFVATR
jgi:hypothetical protein